jgi:hypothetical protein
MNPMTLQQMFDLADTIRIAWEAAATEHPDIAVLFEVDAPYLTIWDGKRCECKRHRILENVYDVPGHRRKAQAFLCIMPGENDEEGIDIVNVHAPSGKPKLTDSHRYHLIRNLLQSSSMAIPTKQIGEGRFVLGGDMNTSELGLSQILNKLRSFGILKTSNEVLSPKWGKHGDMCVVGGFTTTLVQGRARNHDPQHEPYGIAWQRQPHHATEQLTTASDKVAVRPERQMSQLPLETAPVLAWPATEQPDGTGDSVTIRPDRHLSQLPLKQVYQPTWPATEQPDEPVETKVSLDIDSETTRHATEQPQPDENEPPTLIEPEQEIAYVIVNAFLDNVTFQSTAAEGVIKRIILTTDIVKQRVWPPDMLHNIDEVFRPIFFHYPNGLSDRTRAEPRDARQYITQWREIAEWRERLPEGVPRGSQLSASQVQNIMHQYIDNFIHNEAYGIQRAQSYTKNKSRAEARLRRLCGSVLMAKAIWAVGLPNIPEAMFAKERMLDTLVPATEQQPQLEPDVLESIATSTEWILTWLDMLANSIQSHKATPAYQEHARKSGTQKNQSGLTATELIVKESKQLEAQRKYGQAQRSVRLLVTPNSQPAYIRTSTELSGNS